MMMKGDEIVKSLKHLRVQTGSLACMGCGHEHDCGVHGCAIMRQAADLIERIDMTQCKPYTYLPYLTTTFTDGGTIT